MFPFRRKKRVKRIKRVTPAWLTWLAVSFLIYILFTNGGKKLTENTSKTSDQASVTDAEKTTEEVSSPIIDPKKIIDLDKMKEFYLPKTTIKLSVKDTASGEGEVAICGQEVTVKYNSFTEDNKQVETDQKLTFKLGDGIVMPALEKGVLGMKKNSKRTITAPGYMAYGLEKYARSDVPADSNIRLEAEMLDISPALPDISAYRVIGEAPASSVISECGSSVDLHVAIWNVEGKKLYDSRDNKGGPVSFTLGKSEVFLGLEQGALKMSKGMHRNLIVPPSLQKTLNGNEATIKFPFPKNQTVIVDIESIK